MSLSYSGLFSILEENHMNRTSLVKKAGLTHNAILSIAKGEPIAMSALLKICTYFHCDISDVVKIIYGPKDNEDFFFFKISEALEAAGDDRITLEKSNDKAVFYVEIGETQFVCTSVYLAIANRAKSLSDLKAMAEDSVKSALFIADKIVRK